MHRRAVRFGLIFAAVLLAPPAANAADSFFDDGRAQGGLEKIFETAGHPAKVLGLSIRSNRLTVEVQAADNPHHVDSYTDWLATGRLERLLHAEWVEGPQPVELNLINRDLDTNLFELKPADLAVVARLGAAAIKRAALEDAAMIDRMELRRHLYLVPEPRSGDPEWSVEITSGRERATVYADFAGTVTHANLDGSLRAQRLDYLAGGKELDDVVASVADTVGTAPTIRRLIVYDRYLSFEARNPDHPERDSRFSAGLNGVYRDLDDTIANIGTHSDTPPVRFGIKDVDWQLLPKLEDAARQRLEFPGGRVGLVVLSKPNDGVGAPVVEWEISIKSATDSAVEGSVVFDVAGNILRTRYPPGKGPKLDMLDAASIAPAFDALKSALGEHAAVTELEFRTDRLMVTVKDPKNPDARLVFEYRGESLARSIMPPFDWPTFGPDWFFDLAQAQSIATRWAELQHDALTRLGLSDGKIERVTISKEKLFMPHNDRVLAEIRAESGKRSGRVVYDITGKVVDIVKP